jgi:hypothetical protein
VRVLTLLLATWLALQAAYECPMHPEVQAAVAGNCPRCGMALVPRSADRAAGEYRMHVDTQWSTPLEGRLRLRFENANGATATAFQTVHEQDLHLFIVGRDGRYFDHVHPARNGEGFEIDVSLPEAGDYMLFADFVPTGGMPQLLQQLIVTPPARRRVSARGALPPEGVFDRVQEGLGVHLEAEELRAGTPALLTFTVTDAASGKPIRNLELLLGASGHLFFAHENLTEAAHSHPLEQESGPRIRFLTRFALPGRYRVWLQIKHEGRVVTADYVLDVPPPR